jgi:RNA polymerase sigma-70 factor (ECF subfamily)
MQRNQRANEDERGMRTDGNAGAPTASAIDANDARLIRQVVEGNRHAFELLYRSYLPRLARFLNRVTRNLQLIEEIVNDTMLVVWNKAASYDGSCKVSTWVFAIAYRKARKALHGLNEPVDAEPDLREAEPACQPERRFALRRRQEAIDAALAALPLEQRAVVQLAYFHDMGYADIAEVMDCPVNTVKTRMFHARRRLALLLVDQFEEES